LTNLFSSGDQTHCVRSVYFGTANWDQGGFGTAVTWDVSALFKIPDEIASEDAGPLMCAGATVWGALYEYGIKSGDRVGIVGIGGLGHLAIQFAAKMGMEAVVFSSSESKRQEALDFGASEFYATSNPGNLKDITKINHLLITTSFNPDLAT
jgi:D-arabinose 1-dehydrogenase-like Zn-dependent alcohol dehydrogenase